MYIFAILEKIIFFITGFILNAIPSKTIWLFWKCDVAQEKVRLIVSDLIAVYKLTYHVFKNKQTCWLATKNMSNNS